MGYKGIFDRIASGDLGGVFVFHGPEEYVKDRALEQMKARIVSPGFEDLNYLCLENENANAAAIRRAAETLPFMAERRMIVVRDYAMLLKSSRGSGLDSKREAEELEHLTRRFPETTCLVFLLRAEPDTSKSAWKQIVKIADVVAFSRLDEADLIKQLAKMAARCGCTVGADTARFIIQYCGNDLERLHHEMQKACAHAGDGRPVTRAHVEAVCVQSMESRVFQVIDALFAGQRQEALSKLRSHIQDREDAAAFLSLLGRQARLLAAAKAEGRGANAARLAPLLGAPPFAVEAAIRQSARWTGRELADIVAACASADFGSKQGIKDGIVAVEQLAMEIVFMANKRK